MYLYIACPGGISDSYPGIQEIRAGIRIMFAHADYLYLFTRIRNHAVSFKQSVFPNEMKKIFGHI